MLRLEWTFEMTTRGTRPVIVTCRDGSESAAQVARRLEELGFTVESVLEFAGSVVGGWPGDLDRLRKVPGVLAVEESGEQFPL